MATLDFWIEGELGQPHINWHEEVPFDLDRYHYDQVYADAVNLHVARALNYLSKELSEISRMALPTPDLDRRNCE